MFFFTPRYIKEAKHFLHGARKFLAYKKDILTDAHRRDLEGLIDALKSAIRSRDQKAIDRAIHSINTLVDRAIPPAKHAWIRENVEVILVAIVIAAGVKAYLLQPFRIPTGCDRDTAEACAKTIRQAYEKGLLKSKAHINQGC
jgi:signal peptidase I